MMVTLKRSANYIIDKIIDLIRRETNNMRNAIDPILKCTMK